MKSNKEAGTPAETISVSILVPSEVHKKLRALAKADDRSLSSYIRRIIAQHCADKEKEAE